MKDSDILIEFGTNEKFKTEEETDFFKSKPKNTIVPINEVRKQQHEGETETVTTQAALKFKQMFFEKELDKYDQVHVSINLEMI